MRLACWPVSANASLCLQCADTLCIIRYNAWALACKGTISPWIYEKKQCRIFPWKQHEEYFSHIFIPLVNQRSKYDVFIFGIAAFAGISFINNEFNRIGLGKLIDNQLGIRVSTCGYQYSDIVRSWFDIFLCGGDCAEDISQHLRPTLENIPQSKVPSPDTLLRSLDGLAADNTTVISTSGQKYQFNINEKTKRPEYQIFNSYKAVNKRRVLRFWLRQSNHWTRKTGCQKDLQNEYRLLWGRGNNRQYDCLFAKIAMAMPT